MNIRDLFVVTTAVQPPATPTASAPAPRVAGAAPASAPPVAPAAPAPAPAGSATGVFITPQSITSFPVASGVVTALWALAKVFSQSWGKSLWVPLILSLCVGALILMITVSDPSAKPQGSTKWAIAVSVAVINSLFVCSSAVGILGR